MRSSEITTPHRFLILTMMILLALTTTATGKKPHAFREGLKALDRGDWEEAAALLRLALQESPEEDGQRTRIYGSRFERYYPYYYLGEALFNLKCYEESLKQFEKSLSTGAIRGKDLDHLLTLRDKSEELNRQFRETDGPESVPCLDVESPMEPPEEQVGWLKDAVFSETPSLVFPAILRHPDIRSGEKIMRAGGEQRRKA